MRVGFREAWRSWCTLLLRLDHSETAEVERDLTEMRNLYGEPGHRKVVEELKRELERVTGDSGDLGGELSWDAGDAPMLRCPETIDVARKCIALPAGADRSV